METESSVAKSRAELKEAVNVLAESFAGTTSSAPEGAMDWVFGKELRSPNGMLYEKLSEEPSEERLRLFKSVAKMAVNLTGYHGGKVLVIKNTDTGKIIGVACLRIINGGSSWLEALQELRAIGSVGLSGLSRLVKLSKAGKQRALFLNDLTAKEKKNHVHSKTWYAMMIGIHPSVQGQGVGKKMMSAIGDLADQDSLPVYLEASGERNAGFYEHAGGFQVCNKIDVIAVPKHQEIEPYAHAGGMNFMLRPAKIPRC